MKTQAGDSDVLCNEFSSNAKPVGQLCSQTAGIGVSCERRIQSAVFLKRFAVSWLKPTLQDATFSVSRLKPTLRDAK
jgi:hypothetical protein